MMTGVASTWRASDVPPCRADCCQRIPSSAAMPANWWGSSSSPASAPKASRATKARAAACPTCAARSRALADRSPSPPSQADTPCSPSSCRTARRTRSPLPSPGPCLDKAGGRRVQCNLVTGVGRMHLVDTTLFYSPTSGGVRRYLNAKHEWYRARAQERHSLLVPGSRTALQPGDVSTIAGLTVPGTFNYRLPLATRRWDSLLDSLQPDIIEAGDAFHPAWSALKIAARRRIPAVAFFHSHLPRLVGIRCGATVGRMAGRYLRWLYERFDLVFAPSRVMCDYLRSLGLMRVTLQPLGVDVATFHPQRRHPWL